MVIKKIVLSCVMFFAYSFYWLTAQENILYYSFTEDNESIHFTQSLTWDSVHYARSYDVILEQMNENGSWEFFEEYSVKSNVLEISLWAGTYRYNISVRNPLNKKEPPSAWYEFTIIKASKPLVTNIEPQKWFLSEKKEGNLQISGENLLTTSIFSLQNETDTLQIPITMTPLLTEDGMLNLKFDESLLSQGNYTLSVKNPGGLYDSSMQLFVLNNPPKYLFLEGAYAPIITLKSGLFDEFSNKLDFLGVNFEFGAFPTGYSNNSFGINFRLSAYLLTGTPSHYETQILLIPFILSAVYQLPLVNEKCNLSISAGAGISYLQTIIKGNINTDYSVPINAFAITPSVSLNLQFSLTNDLFLTLGTTADVHILLASGFFYTAAPSLGIHYTF